MSRDWGDFRKNPVPNGAPIYRVTLWTEGCFREDWDLFTTKDRATESALDWEVHSAGAYHPCAESYHTITIEITVAEYERLLANQKETADAD